MKAVKVSIKDTIPKSYGLNDEVPERYGKKNAVEFPFIDKVYGTYYLPDKE